ncbi:hypothetical protein RWE15_13130 [Virgibacillus halophilus]|uniref:Uncharacterized protein n=1 Tax=Tigheibacillus halophilus TaxID=361280 RepID=A0ABU5C7L3_9BACI|nr:hypothetical protein [Virgibacillus halophilus]
MDNQIVMLNFDQSYIYQNFYRKESVKWLDFTDMLGVHMFCEKSTAQRISEKLPDSSQGAVTFLGGGKFSLHIILADIQNNTAFFLGTI